MYLWLSKSKKMKSYRIYNGTKSTQSPLIEIILYLQTFALFGLATVGLGYFKDELNHSMTYKDLSDYGLFYAMLTIVILIFFMDAWFYWTHRLLHLTPLFKKSHSVHHKFTNPTVWSGYSLHWLEGLILTMGLFVILLILPHHIISVVTYVMFSIVYTSWLHSGYELFPIKWLRHPTLKWVHTSLHHNIHPQRFDSNYSLYFTFWDKMMGTDFTRIEKYHPKFLGYSEHSDGSELAVEENTSVPLDFF